MPFSTVPLPTDTRAVRLRRWLQLINNQGPRPSKYKVNQNDTQRVSLMKILAYMKGL